MIYSLETKHGLDPKGIESTFSNLYEHRHNFPHSFQFPPSSVNLKQRQILL